MKDNFSLIDAYKSLFKASVREGQQNTVALIWQAAVRDYLQWLTLARHPKECSAQNDVNNRCKLWNSNGAFERLIVGLAVSQSDLGMQLNIYIRVCDAYAPISTGRARLVWIWHEISAAKTKQWYFKSFAYGLCDR